MTHIAHLSPEIILEIMKLLDLHDICTLIKTSPLFLRHFVTHRNQLLSSTVNDLKHRFLGYESPMCLSALRLRCRQTINAPSANSEVREAERASLRLYCHQNSRLVLSKTTALSLLCNARQLLVELEWIVESYAPQAWYEMQDSEIRRPETQALVLSDTERRRFIQAAIHFETYCRIFFRHEKILFKRNASVRQAFFNASHKDGIKKGAFYSIAYYIFDQYLTMISNTSANLSTPILPILEMLNFAHFLTSQGIGLIYKLQCMEISAQTEFMLKWFYKVFQSQDPLVLMASKIDLHRKGTVETRSWQPWRGIGGESFRTMAPWRCGAFFFGIGSV
ncbi:hypothetical protein BKA59DRAFT_444687 [Fusarium tricinctum]|uniref:F-box domain-containing protein n=1 Tax=Fusarium tricinctum TaxID=61284 RepID=A0A8K0W7A5_9HYPO|nr:hypothetical protein BKA59DRAFT_444687 [Fusarium tricinctum]